MHVTQEQLHNEIIGLESRFNDKLGEWISVLRIDMENQRIVFENSMQKQMQLQRFYFQKDMEELMVKQREQFNADIARHMTTLGEEYQWRLSAVGEKVDLTWEKCERKYVELDQKDLVLAEKVALLEEYLPSYPRNHKGKAQSPRVNKESNSNLSKKSSAKNKSKNK